MAAPFKHVRSASHSQSRLTFGFRRAPLAARRPASRCSVAHASAVHCHEWLVSARTGHSHTISSARQFRHFTRSPCLPAPAPIGGSSFQGLEPFSYSPQDQAASAPRQRDRPVSLLAVCDRWVGDYYEHDGHRARSVLGDEAWRAGFAILSSTFALGPRRLEAADGLERRRGKTAM
jgi:hypothetical protein